jgi:hypothetical protein
MPHFPLIARAAALCLAVTSPALGQSATSAGPAAPTASSAPLDVVLLHDGSMFRGTISELVAGDHVVIILASGESKRFAFSTVRYAGPSPGAPPLGASPAPVPSPAAVSTFESGPFPVQFLATVPGLTFYRLNRSVSTVQLGLAAGTITHESLSEICRAPCVAPLERGTYFLSLGIPGEYPVPANVGVRVTSPTSVQASYESRSDFRLAGWLVVAGSVVVGTALSYLSVRDCPPEDRNCSLPRVPLLATGLGIGTVGTIVGLLMTGKDDDATIHAQTWDPR